MQRMLFDDEAASIYGGIDEILPNAENYVVDASRDGKKLLVASYADVRPTEYHVLDLTKRSCGASAARIPRSRRRRSRR